MFNRDQYGIQNEETVFVDITSDDFTYDLCFPDILIETILDVDANLSAITIVAKYDGYSEDKLRIFFTITITYGTDKQLASPVNIPLSGIYQNKESYVVFREHLGDIDVITTTPNDDDMVTNTDDETTNNDSSVDTGDSVNIIPIFLAIASSLMLIILFLTKKKK